MSISLAANLGHKLISAFDRFGKSARLAGEKHQTLCNILHDAQAEELQGVYKGRLEGVAASSAQGVQFSKTQNAQNNDPEVETGAAAMRTGRSLLKNLFSHCRRKKSDDKVHGAHELRIAEADDALKEMSAVIRETALETKSYLAEKISAGEPEAHILSHQLSVHVLDEERPPLSTSSAKKPGFFAKLFSSSLRREAVVDGAVKSKTQAEMAEGLVTRTGVILNTLNGLFEKANHGSLTNNDKEQIMHYCDMLKGNRLRAPHFGADISFAAFGMDNTALAKHFKTIDEVNWSGVMTVPNDPTTYEFSFPPKSVH